MNEIGCNLFEECEAPLCPLQENTIKHGVWYADEGICRSRKFQGLPWIKKQKKIAKLRLTADDGFFSVRMLDSIKVITRKLKGADPDNPNSEESWIKERSERRVIALKKQGDFKAKQKKKLLVSTFG